MTRGSAVQGSARAPAPSSTRPPVSDPPAMPALSTVVCSEVVTSASAGPEASDNGYRSYGESAGQCVTRIRGLLDSGLTTEMIRAILPFLAGPDEIHAGPDEIHLAPDSLTPRTAALLRGEIDRIQAGIDCLARNRDRLRAYLAAVQPDPGA
ncbi:MerR family transcriptional regulator [Streptomyces avermitilis]|uniref:MerR family transcriptional regulator n=2 Tax=Streptomyces avermitilis TaxID=33903 RepID=UPI00339F4AF4